MYVREKYLKRNKKEKEKLFIFLTVNVYLYSVLQKYFLAIVLSQNPGLVGGVDPQWPP